MQQLVFWKETGHAAAHNFFPGKKVVTTAEAWKETVGDWKAYHSMIVLCELDWSYDKTPVKQQHLPGIELVKEMRRTYNMDIPVMFVSFYSLKDIFRAETEILTAIGHDFCQLPANPKALADKLALEEKLTPTELKDIQLFSCHPKGVLLFKIHQIGGIAGRREADIPGRLAIMLPECIAEMHAVVKSDPSAVLSDFSRRFPVIGPGNKKEAIQYTEQVGRELIERFVVAGGESEVTAETAKPWKLLLLDDELHQESDLVTLLRKKGVDVICTTNAGDATNALVNDRELRGKIAVILSDFRLYDFKDDVWIQQKKQGYAFLQEVAEQFHHRILTAVVYSGMPRQFLLETFKTFKIRTEIYSKIDFKIDDANANNFMADRLIEIGNENYEALLALPLASRGWADHLHEPYLMYRRQLDYKKREKDISEFCKQWIEQYRTGQNPATPMIKGDAFRMGTNKNEKDILDRFEAYYKTRRLAQFLLLFLESRKEEDPSAVVAHLLAAKNKNMDGAAAQRGFFSQILGFKKEVFPFGLTIEELCWFEYDMDIEVLKSYRTFRNKLDECAGLIGEFIRKESLLMKSIAAADFSYVDARKHELSFEQQNYNPCLFDRTDLMLCLQWLNLYKNDFGKSSMEELQSLLSNKIKAIWRRK